MAGGKSEMVGYRQGEPEPNGRGRLSSLRRDSPPERPVPDRRHLRGGLCRDTVNVTSSGGRLCPRIRLPSRVVQLHLVACG